MVFLRTTEQDGACFIRTDQMDGETDWKLRLAVQTTQSLPSNVVSTCLGDLHALSAICTLSIFFFYKFLTAWTVINFLLKPGKV